MDTLDFEKKKWVSPSFLLVQVTTFTKNHTRGNF